MTLVPPLCMCASSLILLRAFALSNTMLSQCAMLFAAFADGHTVADNAGSLLTSEAKRHRARLVLGWGGAPEKRQWLASARRMHPDPWGQDPAIQASWPVVECLEAAATSIQPPGAQAECREPVAFVGNT